MSENEFDGSYILSLLHNTIRIVGGNEFKLTKITDFNPEESNYVTGLHSTYIIMLFLFLFWFFIVLMIKLLACRVSFLDHKYISVVLIVSVIFSFFGWMFSLISTVSIKNSLKTIDARKNSIDISFKELEFYLNISLTNFINIEQSNLFANNACDEALNTMSGFNGSEYNRFPYIETLSKLEDIKIEIQNIQNYVKQVLFQLDFINIELGSLFTTWSSYYYTAAFFTIFMTVCLLVIISLIAGSSSFNNELNHSRIHKFFILTVIFNFLMSMVASRAGTLALVGSDFCYNNPDIQLNKLLSVFAREPDICQSETGYKFVCLFQTCSNGQDMLLSEKTILNQTHYYFTEKIYKFSTEVFDRYVSSEGNNLGNDCKRYVNQTINNFYIIDDLMSFMDENFLCNKINTFYEDYLYNSFCNNIVVNYGIVWYSLLFGITGSMTLIAFALLIDLESNNYDSLT